MNLDPDPSEALRELDTLFKSRGKQWFRKTPELIRTAGKVLESTSGAPPGSADFVAALFGYTINQFWTVPGFDWWANQDGAHNGTARDALASLNFNWNRSKRERQVAESSLAAAFLADFRNAYSGWLHATDRTAGGVILLDNACETVSFDFLNLLASAKAEYARRHPAHRVADRILVIAAVPNKIPLDSDAHVPIICIPEEANYQNWTQRLVPDEAMTWWYRITLRDLRYREAERVLCGSAADSAAKVVMRLSGGHPGALGRLPSVLSSFSDIAARGRTANELLDWLLPGMSETVREDLLACAAGQDLEEVSAILVERSEALDDFLTTSFWVNQDDRGRRILHPMLRRLLLVSLEAATPNARYQWCTVHNRLKSFYANKGATDHALYHSLALDELPAVVCAFTNISIGSDPAEWYHRLLTVTQAPRRLGNYSLASTAATKLVSEVITELPADTSEAVRERTEVVARLVAALWIESDPLADPDDVLVDLIKSQLRELASKGWDGFRNIQAFEFFMTAARDYRRSQPTPWTYVA